MGSITENRYRYSIDTQISFLKSPSQTSHPQVSHVFWLSDFELFAPFPGYFHFRFFFGGGGAFLVTIPVTIPSINAQIRYWYSTIPKGIDTVSIVLILFRTIITNDRFQLDVEPVIWWLRSELAEQNSSTLMKSGTFSDNHISVSFALCAGAESCWKHNPVHLRRWYPLEKELLLPACFDKPHHSCSPTVRRNESRLC